MFMHEYPASQMILSSLKARPFPGRLPVYLIILSGLLCSVEVRAASEPPPPSVTTSMDDSSAISPSENERLNQRLEQAIRLFYESNWDESQELLDKLQESQPENPTVFFFDSMMPFWAYFFAGERSDDARRFLERSETAINVSEKRLKSSRSDTSAVLLLSGLHGYRSLVAANEQEYRTAIRSAMTGFNYTRQLLSLDSEDPNAQMGRGVFNYMMGTIPSEVRWLISFSGMSGDRDTGYAQLEAAAEADSYVSNDALMILSYLYLRDGKGEDALRTSQELVDKFPENIIFHYYKARSLEQLRRHDEARHAYEKVVELRNPHLEHLYDEARQRLTALSAR